METLCLNRKMFDTFSPVRQAEILSQMTDQEAVDAGLIDAPKAEPAPKVAPLQIAGQGSELSTEYLAYTREEPVKHRVMRTNAPAKVSASNNDASFDDMVYACWWGFVKLVGHGCLGFGWFLVVTADGFRRAGNWLVSFAGKRG